MARRKQPRTEDQYHSMIGSVSGLPEHQQTHFVNNNPNSTLYIPSNTNTTNNQNSNVNWWGGTEFTVTNSNQADPAQIRKMYQTKDQNNKKNKGNPPSKAFGSSRAVQNINNQDSPNIINNNATAPNNASNEPQPAPLPQPLSPSKKRPSWMPRNYKRVGSSGSNYGENGNGQTVDQRLPLSNEDDDIPFVDNFNIDDVSDDEHPDHVEGTRKTDAVLSPLHQNDNSSDINNIPIIPIALAENVIDDDDVNESKDENNNVNKDDEEEQKKKEKDKKDVDIDEYDDNSDSSESSDEIPLINLDAPSPFIWTIGCQLILLLTLIAGYFQAGGFESIKVNPLYGPDKSTLLLLGAKYGPFCRSGDIWRFITAPFVTPGVIYFCLCLILGVITAVVERQSGFFRCFFVFSIGGAFGYVLSALLVPKMISCGASGAFFGLLGMQLSDLIASWRVKKRPLLQLIGIIVSIAVLIVIGLTPYIDNFTHLGGFVMGILFAIMMLPNLTFGKCERRFHAILGFFAFPIMSTIFMICLVLFYRKADTDANWCEWCFKLNCVNLYNWCNNAD